jgi:hypothetical protein
MEAAVRKRTNAGRRSGYELSRKTRRAVQRQCTSSSGTVTRVDK